MSRLGGELFVTMGPQGAGLGLGREHGVGKSGKNERIAVLGISGVNSGKCCVSPLQAVRQYVIDISESKGRSDVLETIHLEWISYKMIFVLLLCGTTPGTMLVILLPYLGSKGRTIQSVDLKRRGIHRTV